MYARAWHVITALNRPAACDTHILSQVAGPGRTDTHASTQTHAHTHVRTQPLRCQPSYHSLPASFTTITRVRAPPTANGKLADCNASRQLIHSRHSRGPSFEQRGSQCPSTRTTHRIACTHLLYRMPRRHTHAHKHDTRTRTRTQQRFVRVHNTCARTDAAHRLFMKIAGGMVRCDTRKQAIPVLYRK